MREVVVEELLARTKLHVESQGTLQLGLDRHRETFEVFCPLQGL